jgi:hypothetical protein
MGIAEKVKQRLAEAQKQETSAEKYIKQLSKFHSF